MMLNESGKVTSEILTFLIKVLSPAVFLSAVKVMILIQDKKITKANVIVSFLTSTILSATICFQLQPVLNTFWLCIINSILTFSGENFIRQLMYKKDWDKVIDSLADACIDRIKRLLK